MPRPRTTRIQGYRCRDEKKKINFRIRCAHLDEMQRQGLIQRTPEGYQGLARALDTMIDNQLHPPRRKRHWTMPVIDMEKLKRDRDEKIRRGELIEVEMEEFELKPVVMYDMYGKPESAR